MKGMMGFGLLMVLAMSGVSFGYTMNYEWNYESLFSTDNNQGATDAEGRHTYEYRYCNWDAAPTPNGLMGGFHGWETPGTWQLNGGGNEGRIGQNYISASGGGNQSIQIHWVAPTTGEFDVAVSFVGRGGSAGSHFSIWEEITSIKDRPDFWGTDWSWSTSKLSMNAGERLIVELTPWGSGTTSYNDFDMSVALVPEPATVGLLMLGGIGLRRRRRV